MRGPKAWFEVGSLLVRLPTGLLLRVRWTLPLLFLVTFCWTWGSALGCFLVVLAHEVGHAVLARWRGLHVHEIEIHGFGGYCRHTVGTDFDASIIAWGGVLAQALVLAFALPLGTYVHHASFLGHLAYGLTIPNVLMIVANLLPIPPRDGVEAWKLFGRLHNRRARGRAVDDKWRAKDDAMWKAIRDAKSRRRE